MNKEIRDAKKQNMRLYSIYRAISLDLIFYYAIEFLFLTQIKGFTASQVVLSTSFYAIFMIIMQIPASIIVDKFGTRKCTTMANVFNAIFIILIMCSSNIYILLLAQFMSSICFSLKDIADETMLKYSIPYSKKHGDIFSKLEGRGFKNYFLISSLSSIFSGFLFVVNPYIPMCLALLFVILSIILSLGFKDIEEIENKYIEKEQLTIKQHMEELKEGMKFIVKSQRLRSLFLYVGISWGIFALMGTYESSLLVDIGTPPQLITIIIAIWGFAASVGSNRQLQFNNKFKNKSLSTILISVTISIIISGLIVKFKSPYIISLVVIIICFLIINIDKGMSLVLSVRYLGNFSNEKILTKIYASNAMVKNLLRAIIGFFGSYLLDITSTANALIIIGIFLIIISISLIGYMKTRLGLRPEEYDKNEIYNKNET